MSGAAKILIGSGAVADPVDDEFDNVSFLSHFDGSNNGTNSVYDDGSAGNHTMSVAGTPPQGTFGPFARVDGEWSNYFDGTSDYLDIAASSDFDLGTGDFTVEAFINTTTSAGDYYDRRIYVSDGPTGNNDANPMLSINPTGGTLNMWRGSSALITSTSTVTDGAWHHIAMVRSSGTATLYVDGTSEGTPASYTEDVTWNSGSPRPRIGSYNGTQGDFEGYVSNLRVVKGTAVYTGNFTPSTSALTAITNTKLLTFQSNRFIDNSASAHALTVTGTPKASAFTPFLTSEAYDSAVNGASAYFDQPRPSNEGVVYTGTSSDWTWGNDPWTMEMWIYPTLVDTGYDCITVNYPAGNIYARHNSGTGTHILFFIGVSGAVYGEGPATPLNAYTWNHIALVRNGTSYKAYVNGVAGATLTYTHTHGTASAGPATGAYNSSGTEPFPGYISDVRFLKGTALYSSNFTPPTAPLTAITNTVLLLNMADGQALDSAAQNNLTLYGNADTSTTQYKFGTASLALDGSGDFAQIQQAKDLSGPFTIECWARADDTGKAYMWSQGQYTIELALGHDSTDLALYLHGASSWTTFFNGGEFTVNNWHHVAVVRDTSNVIKCYLNGTASGTTVTDSVSYAATSDVFFIGGEWASASTANYTWDGYIDDFRISDFARYTSNFTPTTEAFQDKGQ